MKCLRKVKIHLTLCRQTRKYKNKNISVIDKYKVLKHLIDEGFQDTFNTESSFEYISEEKVVGLVTGLSAIKTSCLMSEVVKKLEVDKLIEPPKRYIEQTTGKQMIKIVLTDAGRYYFVELRKKFFLNLLNSVIVPIAVTLVTLLITGQL